MAVRKAIVDVEGWVDVFPAPPPPVVAEEAPKRRVRRAHKPRNQPEEVSVLSQALGALLNHSKGNKPSGMSNTYGIFEKDGAPEGKVWERSACYGPMGGYGSSFQAEAVWVVCGRDRNGGTTDETAMRYLAWLTGPDSPFYSIVKEQPKEIDGVDIWNPKFLYEHGIILGNTNFPANLVVNFLLFFRIQEYPLVIQQWGKLTEAGVHPTVARYFAEALRDHGVAGFGWTGADGHHEGLNTASASVEYFENFCFGKSMNHNPPFSESTKYLPCNVVWGDRDGRGGPYKNFLKREYKHLFVSREVKGSFGNTHTSNLTQEAVIEIAKAEAQRIGLQ